MRTRNYHTRVIDWFGQILNLELQILCTRSYEGFANIFQDECKYLKKKYHFNVTVKYQSVFMSFILGRKKHGFSDENSY